MRNRALVFVLLLLPFVGGGFIGYGIGHISSDDGAAGPPHEAFTRQVADVPAQEKDSLNNSIYFSRHTAITRAVASASPAVVGINVIEVRQYREWTPWGDDPFFRQFFGDRVFNQQVQGLGSGFLISPDGYILTNDHVAGNAKEITVTLTNGDKYKAELIGTDLISDIALLKIDGKNLPFIKLGNSEDVIIGEWVIALGNPFGLFDISDKPTVTVGVVSGTQMNLQSQDGRVYRNMIQTDASINKGNSGGPLINGTGEVIGVNAVIYTPNQGSIGIGFAIPINRVKAVIDELKKSGKVEREFWTGLEIQNLDRRLARYFGLDRVEGVIVNNVEKGSPAARAGFRPGDVILSVDDEPVADEATMVAIVREARLGDVLNITVFRDRQSTTLKLKLERRPT